MEQKLIPDSSDLGKRTDSWLSERLSLSRSYAANLCEEGNVLLKETPQRKNDRIRPGEYTVFLPPPHEIEARPEDIPLDIVYEDRDLLVVNKPRGMVVHPACGNETGTLVNALLSYAGNSLSGINGVLRPGIVHRLDKDTSGLLIVAKNDTAHRGLAEQIECHSFDREYEALVYGCFSEPSGSYVFPIGRHPVDRKKMAIVPNGRYARTDYRVLASYPDTPATHLRLKLYTGRTHQIRVHLSHRGHPCLGDEVYGNRASEKLFSDFHGQCLHARFISFLHPCTGERITLESDLPEYFTSLLARLRPRLDD